MNNDKDFSRGAAWMRGEIIPTSEAALPVTDWGLTHSDITYDVVHAWDGRFFRLDDYLATPRSGVLEGITRKVSLELCASLGFEVTEKDIPFSELLDADEVFATTTGGGLVPITRINQHIYSNDAPGEISLALQATYWDWHEDSGMSEVIVF